MCPAPISPIVVTVKSFVVRFADRGVADTGFLRSEAVAFGARAVPCRAEVVFGACAVAAFFTVSAGLRLAGAFRAVPVFLGVDCLMPAFFAVFFAPPALFSAGFVLRFGATRFTAFGLLVGFFVGMADSLV